jgi:hypothetical protein
MLDFVITGLGRCRTAWFAALLSDDFTSCRHEFSAECESIDDYAKAARPGKVSGIADTAIWLLGDEMAKVARRVVVIHRDPYHVEQFAAKVWGAEISMEPYADRLLGLHALHVFFDDLVDYDSVNEVVKYCTGRDLDRGRYDLFQGLNIQVHDPQRFLRPLPEFLRG